MPSTTIDWDFILGTIENGKCVLFLGPEASTLPNGTPLQNAMVEHISPATNENVIAHYPEEGLFLFKNDAAKTKVFYKLKDFYKKQEYGNRYAKLAQIPFALTLTANPDGLLKKTFDDLGLEARFDFYKKNNNPKEIKEAITPQNPMVYGVFGSVDDVASLILTHNDMFDFLLSILGDNKLDDQMRALLQDADDFIFLGFDFSKWYVQLFLRLLNLHNPDVKFARYASNTTLSDATKQFCREQFNIEFTDHPMDKFVDELFEKCEAAGLLRKTGDTASSPHQMVEQAIKRGELEDAFRVMEDFFKEHAEDFLNDLIGLRSNYTRNRNKLSQGIISHAEAELAINKITVGLLDLNKELKALELAVK